MNRWIRAAVSSVAVVGTLAMPAIATAQENAAPLAYQVARSDDALALRDRDRRDRDDRARYTFGDRDRWGRARMEHERACGRAYAYGASRWQLQAMGCFVR